VQRWEAARSRTFLARHTHEGIEEPADYWAELRVGTEIAREVQCGRWVVVASLLRAGAVTAWAEVGGALGMSETEARDGFHAWIAGQVALSRRTGSVGLTRAEAGVLTGLAEAVTW
jgi:hypothetical protein